MNLTDTAFAAFVLMAVLGVAMLAYAAAGALVGVAVGLVVGGAVGARIAYLLGGDS